MPPKKRPKITTNDVDQAHNSNIIESSSQTSDKEPNISDTAKDLISLSLLPADVILYIYQFLSPIDLLTLFQLGDRILNELIYFQKEVNFSVCRKANFELVSSYFSRERVKHIKKLNFSYYMFAKPYDLVQLICKCKHLSTLSIVECGIQYKQLSRILKNCSVLKELTWNVKKIINEKIILSSSVTKLYLFCYISDDDISCMRKIIQSFPKIENVTVCFCPSSVIVPPLIGPWAVSTYSKNIENSAKFFFLRHKISVSTPREQLAYLEYQREARMSGVPWTEVDDYHDNPPFLKICTSNLPSGSSCCPNIYSSVSVLLAYHFENLSENFLTYISKVGGTKLKQLTVEHAAEGTALFPEGVSSELLYEKVCHLLESIIFNCQNITVLNIGAVHFTSVSPSIVHPFVAMCVLKHLEVLCIPTCAFPQTTDSLESANELCSEFEALTLKCWKVEDFHLICCCNTLTGRGIIEMQDTKIYPIQNWKLLKSLSLYSANFRTFRFLRKVADFCPEFQMFSYIMSFPGSGCIYYDDVIYLLMNSKKLSFIRINDARFNPMFGRFMSAVSSAKNLEGICFMTFRETVFASSFIKYIESLKYLHLFHFYAPRVSTHLYDRVRKSMQNNGIKNIQVEECCSESYLSHPYLDMEYKKDITPHRRPMFSCLQLHLEKFLFDCFSLS